MTANEHDRLDEIAQYYIDELTCLSDLEKDDLMARAFSHSVFCNSWLELKKYIDGKKVEIIISGKMQPDPEAMDFGSWE